ncbi:37S ribosomal protein Rsm24 [Blastomyces gilchristii SLH14081]|uniref:37S ribosomal protein Rsm24 n=1 Tax=Blastomyces gilchristii (strain SLH14081) TaxID=559298 RepID=A0A179UL01_BLAGS|nr:mitochondrial 37S ribosome protein domain-containing protein [Blastomyces gilchristii SLH14081]OAT08654.1 37S ribosomal protein Rsm24 [Blastomyces gilchristii SLH14081]
MASVTTSIGRAALVLCRQTAPKRSAIRPNAFRPQRQFAPFSHASQLKQNDLLEVPEYSTDLLDGSERAQYDAMAPDQRETFDREFTTLAKTLREQGLGQTMNEIHKEAGPFIGWTGGNEDVEDYFNDDIHRLHSEPYMQDGMTSMAYDELEQHRELREFARIAAWEMPLLSNHAKPFTLPDETHLLRFRYTTYMGETHPAETKVVVEFCSKDLVPNYLTEEQRITLLKLVGPRYNPDQDLIRMSAENYPTRAQNKRYLGDLVDSLIKEAKEGDSFADVPLDLRHHKPKTKLNFPKEWAMTEERKQQLQERRERLRLTEAAKATITDGNEVIQQAINSIPALNPALQVGAGDEHAGKEPVLVRARSAPAPWKPFSGRR